MAQMRAFKLGYIFVDPVHTFESVEVFGRALQRVRTIGFEGAEISATPHLISEVEALKKTAADAGIPICSLMSGWSYFNEGLCLCSPDTALRERAVTRLIEYVHVAAQLGAVLVFGQMQGFRRDEPDGAVANERIAERLHRVARAAEERSVTEPIHLVGRNLAHVHLCETNGAMLGTGHLDVPAVVSALTEIRYQGYVSVKIYRAVSWEQGA